jgi:calcium-dependent protein kinase
MWSAGVILYVMLSGYPPYDGDTQEEIFAAILKAEVEFDDDVWEEVSDEAKDLIMQLLTSEDSRLSAKQALKHPWFKKFLGKKKSKSIQIDHLNRLKGFQKMNKMRKAILTFLASRVSNEDIETQITSFHQLDKNKDGYITMKELQKGLKESHDADEITEIMGSVDTDKNGAIDYNEFIAATLDAEITKNLKKLDMAFKFFDKNGDGVIDQNDMGEALVGEEFKYVGGDIIKGIFDE